MEYIKLNDNGSVEIMRQHYNYADIDEKILNAIADEMITELEISSKKGNRHAILEVTNTILTDKEKDMIFNYFEKLGYNSIQIKEDNGNTAITVGFSSKVKFY